MSQKRDAYSLLLGRGLIRVGLDVPAGAEFVIDTVADPAPIALDPALPARAAGVPRRVGRRGGVPRRTRRVGAPLAGSAAPVALGWGAGGAPPATPAAVAGSVAAPVLVDAVDGAVEVDELA